MPTFSLSIIFVLNERLLLMTLFMLTHFRIQYSLLYYTVAIILLLLPDGQNINLAFRCCISESQKKLAMGMLYSQEEKCFLV